MSYRREATIRIAYLTGAAILSTLVSVIIATLAAKIFANANHKYHDKIFVYSCIVIFAIICGLSVYRVDKVLNKRYNSNP